MDFISDAVRALLLALNTVTPNWGVTIILFTFLYRILLFPLQWRATEETKKIRTLEPELSSLRERHRSSPEAYLRETRKLKDAHGVRSGLPLVLSLIQMPIFIGVYRSIGKIAALKSSAFLWLPNLALADPTYLLPLAMLGLTLLQQARTQTPAPIPKWILPSVSFAFMAVMPASLVLHSIVSTVVQMGGERIVERFS